jgi:DNA-directed RNA polymerase subunit beta
VKRYAIKDQKIQPVDDDEIDVDMTSPNQFFGSHINLIPLQSAVQGPRLFYGARFYNQALPVVNAEAPLVQNLIDGDEKGRSFDEHFGKHAGALHAGEAGQVLDVNPDEITYKNSHGETKKHSLYNAFPFNRKTSITQTPLVKAGDHFEPGHILAKSNYTDNKGTLALGLNARIGLLPYKGHSMDDAIVISEPFAKRLTSDHAYTLQQDYDHDVRGGHNHYVSLFPTVYRKDQLKSLDERGVARVGTVLHSGDPMILATRPKSINSQVGNLSKAMRQARGDATQTWDEEEDGIVTDVVHNKNNVKLVVKTLAPTKVGDKIVMRSGQKGVVSLILPEDHMPRTAEGKPLEVLANHLGIPSRVNDSLVYETLLGKVARKQGKTIKLPSFNKPGENWYDLVKQQLDEAGLKETETLYDPLSNKRLENPVTVGDAYILKLHHTASSKESSRGQAGYSADQQPLKGGGPSAQAKRLSGLEIHSMLSAGAYKNLREGATLRGQKNDEYWRAIRAGHTPRNPGPPFVWEKFQTLLMGAGLHARKIDDARMRLGPFTEKDLDARNPVEVKKGDTIDPTTMEPIEGGLFDSALVGNNAWGRIPLPFAVPNPAFEHGVRHLLGLTQKELREIMAGRMALPEHLQ